MSWPASPNGVARRAAGPRAKPDQGAHEGHEWLYVITGRLRLTLGDKDFILTAGEAADFDTRIPHAVSNAGSEPAELLNQTGGPPGHTLRRTAALQPPVRREPPPHPGPADTSLATAGRRRIPCAYPPLEGALWGADLAAWQEECEASRISAAARSLDDTGLTRAGESCSLRWIYVHMIEEYARHNGHADLIRELSDGAVGW